MNRLLRWFRTKRVCSWCRSSVDPDMFGCHIRRVGRFDLRGYMGGNPFATNISHGVCKACKVAVGRELMKHNFHA